MKLRRVARALTHAWRMTNPWFPHVRDARDEPVPLYSLNAYGRTPNSAADLPEPAFAAIRARLLAQTHEGMGHRPWVLSAMALAYSLFLLYLWRVPAPRYVLWTFAFAPVSFVVMAITYRYRIPKIGPEAIIHSMLLEHRCPSCAYDLSATSPDPDGCTTCPECGAAWRMPEHR